MRFQQMRHVPSFLGALEFHFEGHAKHGFDPVRCGAIPLPSNNDFGIE